MKTTSETIVILGGTSAVAMAYARNAAMEGHNIILVGRNKKKLTENEADLNTRGTGHVQHVVADLSDTQKIASTWKALSEKEQRVDRVLLAYGVLGDQDDSQKNIDELGRQLTTNFVSAAMWSEAAFESFRQAGAGQLTVIGSVAGDRGRQSNYHYGAAKGALDTFLQGMSHRAAKLNEAKIGVLLVKPGFIDTPMTDHIEKGGPLWATPEKVAHIIKKAEKRGRRVIYAPWFWWGILMIIRNVPFFVFKRTSL